jgi:hypothetical protein
MPPPATDLVPEAAWPSGSILELLRLFQPLANRRVQLTGDQVLQVAGAILRRPRCNVLFFGLGQEAPFWCACNRGGRTTFIEDQAAGVTHLGPVVPGAEICAVSYATRLQYWLSNMDFPQGWPAALNRVRWDIILVDGPQGFKEGHPGRQQSIWVASCLMNPGTLVWVHDYERPWERKCADAYLGPPDQVSLGSLGVLAQWRHDTAPVRSTSALATDEEGYPTS